MFQKDTDPKHTRVIPRTMTQPYRASMECNRDDISRLCWLKDSTVL